MKYKSFSKLLLLSLSFVFVLASCTKEGPMGPAGADGQDGTNGTNGTDGTNGVDGIAFCLECHTNTTIDALTAQWAPSGHASGSSLGYAGTRSGCSECHSGVGFVANLAGSEDISGSPINCSACHSHGEPPVFQNGDGEAIFVRTVSAVTLRTNPSAVIDMGSSANLCTNCHQPMTGVPVDDDGDGMFDVTSTHYGPHHGPQSVILEGMGGVEFAGSIEYPGTKSHPHRKSRDCVSCHMQEGSHAFSAPELSACTTCHSSATDFNVHGKLDDIHDLLVQLEGLLETEGIIHEGHPVVGSYPIDVVSAFYNYALVEEDKSEGVHNPKYVEALLTNTIEALGGVIASN